MGNFIGIDIGLRNMRVYFLGRKHRIAVEEISIDDPYTKEPRKCLFTYKETLVTGRSDDAFKVNDIFEIPQKFHNCDLIKDV